MSIAKHLRAFFDTRPHASSRPEPSAHTRGSGKTLQATPLYNGQGLPPPTSRDYARVLAEWNDQRLDDPDLTWTEFIDNLDQRRMFYTAERREREAELAQLQSRIKPLP